LKVEKMVEAFSLSALSKSAPIHSVKKLEWFNTSYIRNLEDAELAKRLGPYLEKAGLPTGSISQDYLRQVAGALKENLVLLSQVEDYLGIFFDETFRLDDEARTILTDGAGPKSDGPLLAEEPGHEFTFGEDLSPGIGADVGILCGRRITG
jgi:glutamyl-tRNA synthetase